MRSRILLASVSVVFVAAACGAAQEVERTAPTPMRSGSTSSAPAPEGSGGAAPQEAAEEVVITISDFAFQVPDSVPPGAEVTVINEDASFHTVTADDGAFDVGARQGEPVTFTAPEEPGEYPFHCSPHPNMTATLVVGS